MGVRSFPVADSPGMSGPLGGRFLAGMCPATGHHGDERDESEEDHLAGESAGDPGEIAPQRLEVLVEQGADHRLDGQGRDHHPDRLKGHKATLAHRASPPGVRSSRHVNESVRAARQAHRPGGSPRLRPKAGW
ncbi:hypothetical protein GCM10009574_005510 [Streptomyces asiaticus]|uniref:Uncharacterized protein n=2 Tax=Streptomyces rhizosphaericus TaxID=114699 RepID=A0ABN1S4W7_9ACTN